MPALFAALGLAACGSDTPATPAVEAAAEQAPEPGPWIIAAAHPLATKAGAKILEGGGSAVDAAIAVQAVLGLVEPQSSGLGGGAFMLFYDASADELIAYDGRETAPFSAHAEIFLKDDGTAMGFYEAVTSGFSVGVPGTVAMLDMAHRRHGKLEWSALFEPAEELAREGFPMPQRLHDTAERFARFREEPQAAVYLREDGSLIPIGGEVRNEAYAETVSTIASQGAAGFYGGEIAEAIVARVNEKTGEPTILMDDFLAYEPIVREPVCADVYERKVCSMPPPSSGGVTLLQILRMMEMRAPGTATDDALLAYLEVSRLAYADRGRFLGDPTAMGTEGLGADALVERLVSDDYLSERSELIGGSPLDVVEPGDPDGAALRDERADDSAYEVPSTTHFSIRDGDGNVVSMTASVEMPFGSQMMAGGMVLNNQLTDFARLPEIDGRPSVNAPGPGKRPMSSMTPVIIFGDEGSPIGAIGSPGGSAIIGYVARPLIDHLATGEKLSEAILKAHVVVPRGSVIVESGAPETEAALRELGYEVTARELSSGLYGFTVQGGEIDLVVDPRREGSARMGTP
jgi:gamma-glutamyltranspeptidase/glutathione hydrolase